MTFGVRCGAMIGGRSSARSDEVWIESGTACVRPSKLDKKGKVEDKSFQQLPLLSSHTLPKMSSSKYTPSAMHFGLSLAGNPEHAVYHQSSHMVMCSTITNPAHAESDLTRLYPTTNEVRLQT